MQNELSKSMSRICYSTKGYWKGFSAVSKLASAAKVREEEARKWLEKQALWQIYLPAPKYIPRPHWEVSKPNMIHQADLLFLPHDTVGRKTYKYALVVVDIATRYKDAEPLTSKEFYLVAKAFEKIYSRKLDWPLVLMVDPGKEFFRFVNILMKKHAVKFQRSEAGNDRAQSFVERANRTLSERLFSHQYAQEMITEGRSVEWVKRLPAVIKAMNNESTKITGQELTEIRYNKPNYKRVVGLDEVRLPPGVKVRFLFTPGDEGGEKRRATDPIWSLETYDLSRSVVQSHQPVLYYLSEGAPRRSFVREELQVVPEDTQLPPDSVL